MSQSQIVVIEDDEDIREILELTLSREGFRVASAEDGGQGLRLVQKELPDLVLLDLMLPDLDGLEVCRLMKADAATREIGIIMVSAKDTEADIVLGLGLGADDYVPKPFGSSELVARVKSVLRRRSSHEEPLDEKAALSRGPLRMDPERHRASVDGAELGLTATEYKILHMLARHPGRIFARGQIISNSRGELAASFERSVDAHVRTLRKKLGEHRGIIETVRSIGYRFAEGL